MVLVVDTFTVILNRILAFLQANTSRITDYNEGSVIRTLSEAVASEFDKQYFQTENVQQASFLLTAAGSDLDNRANDFGMARVPATFAQAVLTLTRLTPAPPGGIAIPAGSIWTTIPQFTSFDAIRFTNPAPSSIPAGMSTVNINVTAVVAGSTGNVLANSILVNASNVPGVDSVTNALPPVPANDQETDDQLRARIALKLKGNNAGTLNSYKLTLLSNTQAIVTSVSVVGPGEPLMTRDGGVGGKLDIYFKGNVNPQNAVEIFTFVNGTDYFFSPYTFNPPDFPNARNAPVNFITSVHDDTAGNFLVQGVDYTFAPDTSIFARSDRAKDRIAMTNMPARDGHQFTVMFQIDQTVGALRSLIEPLRPVTADLIIKEGIQQLLDANIKPFYAPGVDKPTAQAAMQTALSNYISGLNLGDTAVVTEAIRQMSEVKVNGVLAVTGFDKTITSLFFHLIPSSNSTLTVPKNTFFVLNLVTFL